MRTFTGSVYVVVEDRPVPVVFEDRAVPDERTAGEVTPAPAANVPGLAPASAAPSTRTDALATSLTPTVARNVVSTARLAATGMATGVHHVGSRPRRMGSSTRYADAVATPMMAARRTPRSGYP